jgi:hypothetical protein
MDYKSQMPYLPKYKTIAPEKMEKGRAPYNYAQSDTVLCISIFKKTDDCEGLICR